MTLRAMLLEQRLNVRGPKRVAAGHVEGKTPQHEQDGEPRGSQPETLRGQTQRSAAFTPLHRRKA